MYFVSLCITSSLVLRRNNLFLFVQPLLWFSLCQHLSISNFFPFSRLIWSTILNCDQFWSGFSYLYPLSNFFPFLISIKTDVSCRPYSIANFDQPLLTFIHLEFFPFLDSIKTDVKCRPYSIANFDQPLLTFIHLEFFPFLDSIKTDVSCRPYSNCQFLISLCQHLST